MRRKGHPSFPSAMTCCFFSSLKTLLMPKEPIRAPLGVNVPGLTMAGFQLTLHGRIWVIPVACICYVQNDESVDGIRFTACRREFDIEALWRVKGSKRHTSRYCKDQCGH